MIGETICIHDALHRLVSKFIIFCDAISNIITCTTTPASFPGKSCDWQELKTRLAVQLCFNGWTVLIFISFIISILFMISFLQILPTDV